MCFFFPVYEGLNRLFRNGCLIGACLEISDTSGEDVELPSSAVLTAADGALDGSELTAVGSSAMAACTVDVST